MTDSADHVWTEYWSEAGERWIHMDPCEAAYDKPLLYEVGPLGPTTHGCDAAADLTGAVRTHEAGHPCDRDVQLRLASA